jgi:RHH-type proline utilization regulon transcriptional repressor/proline dehydrogenase/delta 1-pyrroline-5-carboxylate dehydrogenase
MNTQSVTEIADRQRGNLEQVLADFRADEASPHSPLVQKAVFLARRLQTRAQDLQTPQERRQQAELDRMIKSPHDKATIIQLTDQAFRTGRSPRIVDQLTHILDVQGIPRFFSAKDKTLLRGFQSFGGYLPGVAAPLVKGYLEKETANVILPAEYELLAKHLTARRKESVRMNVNFLGEAILSEQEAERRLQDYIIALQKPEVEVVSIKISTIYSQISPLARRHTIRKLCERLELLLRAASRARFTRADGTVVPKFVYLDMEEYRDLDLTVKAFMETLDRPGFEQAAAGIALQAYVPDSYLRQLELNEWARRRVAAGGSPITMRIVKGANMEMERVEASVHNRPQAPYKTKPETDANFKRMLLEGMKPENLEAVRIGVASHNLFDLSLGVVLALENDALDCVQFEMLEGMANHQRRAMFELTNNLLLYAPACRKIDFLYAIGYLVRRLDENTGPDNFLAHAFKVNVDGPDWRRLEEQFLQAYRQTTDVSSQPRRTQDRNQPPPPVAAASDDWRQFKNEPDTDFSLPQNSDWAEQLLSTWHGKCGDDAIDIPLWIAGEEVSDRPLRDCLDPSRPGVVVGRYRQASEDDVDQAVAAAKEDPDGWRLRSPEERASVLRGVAQEIRRSRGELMGAACADGGKTLLESDPEVSEAVDFVEFYTQSAGEFYNMPGVRASGKGVVAVVSPWNFPIAIPCGGVAAALAAGNTVILKPASATVLTAHVLCECFRRAGVPRTALQLVPCSGATGGQRLVTHDDVDVVILTGGTDTALHMLDAKPSMNLLAETGGKNATIVTALSDRDMAIKHVLHSAFSHGGQKCSATSLLVLEEEVYNDAKFKQTLCDAVASLRVGSAWEPPTKIGPLIHPPSGDLERGLKELEPGESWAVMPHIDDDNPCLVSPGVKWGVTPGSFTHLTELFGPVLGVMKFKDLPEAIEIVNATGYGLTSGLESLDDREQELWLRSIRAGNLYVNRSTTGAIVLRQPFGGMGKSAFGPGVKAGGPNYVAQLMDFVDEPPPAPAAALADSDLTAFAAKIARLPEGSTLVTPEDVHRITAALASYEQWTTAEFRREHDHFRLIGEDNRRRYLPVEHLRIRVDGSESFFELAAMVGGRHESRWKNCRLRAV